MGTFTDQDMTHTRKNSTDTNVIEKETIEKLSELTITEVEAVIDHVHAPDLARDDDELVVEANHPIS